jgi:biopolymer transport protein ExbD
MRFAPPRPRRDEERILPLINVVFLLLIFFMVAGRFTLSDPWHIEPPRSASEGIAQARELVVMVGADGRLALDGVEMDDAGLEDALRARLADTDPSLVRLKADGRVEATRVVGVMELLRDAGASRLRLLTLPAGR